MDFVYVLSVHSNTCKSARDYNCNDSFLFIVLDKKGAILNNMLNEFYASRPNAFVDGLKLYANCNNRNSSKANSLAYIVIEELYNFKTSRRIYSESYLDENTKMVAFNFGKLNGQHSFFKLIVTIYNLVAAKQLFVEKVRDMVREHNYKDVSAVDTNIDM